MDLLVADVVHEEMENASWALIDRSQTLIFDPKSACQRYLPLTYAQYLRRRELNWASTNPSQSSKWSPNTFDVNRDSHDQVISICLLPSSSV